MRIHLVATLALLTAAVVTGCDSPREVRDTGRANAYGCDSCHGYPPPPAFNAASNHPVGVTASMCNACHSATVAEDGHTILPTMVETANGQRLAHRNGQVEAEQPPYTNIACDRCHGAPPVDISHMFHVVNRDLACGTCHRGFDVGDGSAATRATAVDLHMNGQADVVLDDEAGTVLPASGLTDEGTWAVTSCRPCHRALGVSTN